jgi:hypothetical protein
LPVFYPQQGADALFQIEPEIEDVEMIDDQAA